MTRVRVALPPHLRLLAGLEGETVVDVPPPATLAALLDALEERHPVLRGTIRHHEGDRRRPLVRFYAGGRDLSHDSLDRPLPSEVVDGGELVQVIGAIAGG